MLVRRGEGLLAQRDATPAGGEPLMVVEPARWPGRRGHGRVQLGHRSGVPAEHLVEVDRGLDGGDGVRRHVPQLDPERRGLRSQQPPQ
jgi:hypothetical protein